ncbi:MAG TPA: hypothetical protein VL485_15605 [Ktedonobacteraceae bacterium]|jgi:hypothetical protein|nr:hypothetical protein [Ktedonobacteraceae bacterium]
MKKEEFPTFLNEQPTVIFGRTGRELLIIACGLFAAYRVWDKVSNLLPSVGGSLLAAFLVIMIVIGSLVLALLKVGYRHLEEWVFTWLFFVSMPRVYLYKPWEDEVAYEMESEESNNPQEKQVSRNELNDLDENLEDN